MEAYKMSVMWYGSGILPEMRKMSRETVQAIGNEASAIAAERALQYCPEKEFIVPSWSPAKISGMQVISLMVVSLWIQCGEREDIAHPLMDAWPIKEMVFLASGKQPELEMA